MKIEWHKVTWYSKLLAVIVLFGFLGLAYHFYQQYRLVQQENQLSAIINFGGLANPVQNNDQKALKFKTQTIKLESGKTFTLNVLESYSITVAAQNFRHARFMAWSPDHRLFLGEMTDAGDTNTGRVMVMDDFNQASGSFKTVHTYLDNLRNPNSLTFYTDTAGKQWIYVALTDKLVRYSYVPGQSFPGSQPQTIATFPAFGQSPQNGGWHLTRTVIVHNNKFYVSVGSSCNSCEETQPIRGVILEMNPDGSAEQIIASGLRNAVGIKFAGDNLYATANEADHLGPDRPQDLLYRIEVGTNYGWPYCYQFQGKIYKDTSQNWKNYFDCSKVPLAFAPLSAHSAPLGLEFFGADFVDPVLQNSFLVAEHGSGKPGIGTGYALTLVGADGSSRNFISGFLQNGQRVARPVDVLKADNKSFFFSDDFNGAIYYVQHK